MKMELLGENFPTDVFVRRPSKADGCWAVVRFNRKERVPVHQCPMRCQAGQHKGDPRKRTCKNHRGLEDAAQALGEGT